MKTLVFDTETTDLLKTIARPLHKRPKIIELFGIVWDSETDEETDHGWLINPEMKIPPKITEITQITDEMVKDKPVFEVIAPDVRKVFESADRLVAHNISFDMSMVETEFDRLALKHDDESLKINFPKKRTCTVEATEWIKGHRISLTDLYQYLFPGETFTGAHRAEVDVRANLRSYKELLKRKIIRV